MISEIAKLAAPENLYATLYVSSFVLVWYRLGKVEKTIASKLENGLTEDVQKLKVDLAALDATVKTQREQCRKSDGC